MGWGVVQQKRIGFGSEGFDLRNTYGVGEVADHSRGWEVITYISSVVYNDSALRQCYYKPV